MQFNEYEADYYSTCAWPVPNSDIPDTPDLKYFPELKDEPDIQDIWDEHDIVDNPGTLDDSDIPIGIGYLGDIS